MKRFLLFIALFPVFCFSQGCLPEGIVFSMQEQIDNFQNNHPGCTELEGDVLIKGNDINNLDGLSILTTLGGYLSIGDDSGGNPNLTSLAGLNNLTYIGEFLRIFFNPAITNLTGLGNLTFIDQGGILIHCNESLIDLSGLESIIILNDLSIYNNSALINFSGLENLTDIVYNLIIIENPSLVNLNGLENVTSLGSAANMIQENNSLLSLSGLDNVISIDGIFAISNNDALMSLSNLSNLTFLEGQFAIHNNNSLTSLSGLDNIDAESFHSISIYDNLTLSACEVQSICNYLTYPNGNISIHDNAPGCNSPEEVEEACFVNIDESVNTGNSIQIFPNPATKEITILCSSVAKIIEVCIFNQTGGKLVAIKDNGKALDISSLNPGLYIIKIKTKNDSYVRKLIIE